MRTWRSATTTGLDRLLAARDGSRKQLVVRLVLGVLFIAAGVACAAAGLSGRPLPSRFSTPDVRLWVAHGPGAFNADCYLWFAIAASAIALGVLAIVLGIRPRRRAVTPLAFAVTLEVEWLAALALLVIRWLSGAPYANYLPADSYTFDYVGSIVVTVIVLGLLAFLHVLRFRAWRRRAASRV
jgi:amino acid transporter